MKLELRCEFRLRASTVLATWKEEESLSAVGIDEANLPQRAEMQGAGIEYGNNGALSERDLSGGHLSNDLVSITSTFSLF